MTQWPMTRECPMTDAQGRNGGFGRLYWALVDWSLIGHCVHGPWSFVLLSRLRGAMRAHSPGHPLLHSAWRRGCPGLCARLAPRNLDSKTNDQGPRTQCPINDQFTNAQYRRPKPPFRPWASVIGHCVIGHFSPQEIRWLRLLGRDGERRRSSAKPPFITGKWYQKL